jgi:hypothetical protein
VQLEDVDERVKLLKLGRLLGEVLVLLDKLRVGLQGVDD